MLKLLKNIFYIILLIFLVNAKKRHHHNNKERTDSVTIDPSGYCHSSNLNGRCIRFQDCPTAVRLWQESQKSLISCYYTAYENFVCCPDLYGFFPPIPYSSNVPLPPQPWYSSPPQSWYSSPPQPSYPSPVQSWYPSPPQPSAFQPVTYRPYTPTTETPIHISQTNRLSEEKCGKFYKTSQRNRRSARPVRSTDVNADTNESEVKDDLIEKETISFTQVVGGSLTAEGEFPYMCALGCPSETFPNKTDYICGCVLIARKYVLTVAHCATLGSKSPTVVHLGGGNLDDPQAEIIHIENIVQHPDFIFRKAYNDIAIIKLKKRSRSTPACLWSLDPLTQSGVVALGYGKTEFNGRSSNQLLKADLSVVPNPNCNTYYNVSEKLNHGIVAGHLCAGDGLTLKDTCQGDSGGPLLVKQLKDGISVPYVVGLTSFGDGCGIGKPSVYTRVSNYIDWIEKTIWGN